jgi:hypothetical protein
MSRVRLLRHVVQLVAWLVVDYFAFSVRSGASDRRAARRRLLRLRRASGCFGTSRGSSCGSSSTTSTTPRVRVPRHVASARRAARRRLLRLCRASGCFGTSRGSSSTTSPLPRVRVPRHVARLVTRLVVDYFYYAARSVASARRAARRVARRLLLRIAHARRRLLRLRRASRCLRTSRGSSCVSSSTMPRVRLLQHIARLVAWLIARLVVDYFASAARPSTSAHRAARRATRRQLVRLRRASGCFGTSCGTSHRSSRGSSSTTSPRAGSSSTASPTLRVRVPRHVARLVLPLVVDYFASCRLVVDYFAYTACPGASARRAARLATCRRLLRLVQARRRLLRLRYASRCLSTSRGSSRRSPSTTSLTPRI